MTDDLNRWESRYQQAPPLPSPHPLLDELRDMLPAPGGALVLACGLCPNAEQLIEWGWSVTAVDISPTALARVASRCPDVETRALDLVDAPLPPGPWDLVVCQNYLDRALFPRITSVLEPGGALVFRQPTVENLTRNPRPSQRFLLEPGEAARLAAAAGLRVVWSREGWSEGRHEGQVLAYR